MDCDGAFARVTDKDARNLVRHAVLKLANGGSIYANEMTHVPHEIRHN